MFSLPSESVPRSQQLFSFQNHILVVLWVRKQKMWFCYNIRKKTAASEIREGVDGSQEISQLLS